MRRNSWPSASAPILEAPISSAGFHHGFEVIGGRARGSKQRRVVGRQAVVAHEALAAGVGELGHLRFHAVDFLLGDHQGQEIGIGKIAVVLRVLLGAHRASLIALRVVEPRFLLDASAVFQHLDLPPRLELDRALHEAEGVQVLDLAARAELSLPGLPDRDIGVAAKRSLLHVAVADADPDDQGVQRARVGDRFLCTSQVGLGDNLQKRRAGAIEVDAGHAMQVFME
jgi:hypothetical protein